jgi:DNA polymerase
VPNPLDELQKIVATCTSCPLHETRSQTVFGRGWHEAPLMIVGEAPGRDEDAIGLPFVGRAGRLLTQLLDAAHVPEDQIFFCNVLKCRPPDNKFPTDGEEPEICRKYLLEQIKVVSPKAIILTGKRALQYVLLHGTHETHEPLMPWINKQCRRRDLFGDIRFLVVYHPSYMMRSPIDEDQEAWVQSVAQIWSFASHKLSGTAPAPTPFKEIRPAPQPPRMGRNLFAQQKRKKVL